MPSIYDLYEYYLDPADLKEKAHLVQVQSAKVEKMFNPRTRKPEDKIVLRFVNRRKAMILNKTQAGALMTISGTDDYTKWKGVEVVLVADRASNGRDTIRVCTREDSGDADLAFAKDWRTVFHDIYKQIGMTDADANKILQQCEGDHRSAAERLIAEYHDAVLLRAV
jgi:hypothetical protein